MTKRWKKAGVTHIGENYGKFVVVYGDDTTKEWEIDKSLALELEHIVDTL